MRDLLRRLAATAKFVLFWAFAAPRDAWRAGAEYSILVAPIAGILGVPWIVVRLVIGPFIAGAKYY